jgi:anti-anti-sigma regulatory factor
MRISTTISSGWIVVHLGETLRIEDVLPTKASLLQVVESGNRVEFNLSSVTEIDTAGIQLLLLVRREAKNLDKECRFTQPSAAVREAFELVRRTDFFDEPLLTA